MGTCIQDLGGKSPLEALIGSTSGVMDDTYFSVAQNGRCHLWCLESVDLQKTSSLNIIPSEPFWYEVRIYLVADNSMDSYESLFIRNCFISSLVIHGLWVFVFHFHPPTLNLSDQDRQIRKKSSIEFME